MQKTSAVILGGKEIWRIDPTGQFWKCHATVIGQDADHGEETLHRRLMEGISSLSEQQQQQQQQRQQRQLTIPEYLNSLSYDEALQLAKEVMESRLQNQLQQLQQTTFSSKSISTVHPDPGTTSGVEATPNNETTTTTSLDAADVSTSIPQIYWHAVILDYSNDNDPKKPQKIFKHGIFVGR